jgi:vacuolar-type H+-ATPase subunit F/Vma7
MGQGRIVVIGGQDVVLGLGFLGFEGHAVGTEAEAQRVLEAVLADPDVALVLLGEDWAVALREHVVAAAGAEEGPLVVEIPAPLAPRDGTSLHKRVELALGISLEE